MKIQIKKASKLEVLRVIEKLTCKYDTNNQFDYAPFMVLRWAAFQYYPANNFDEAINKAFSDIFNKPKSNHKITVYNTVKILRIELAAILVAKNLYL